MPHTFTRYEKLVIAMLAFFAVHDRPRLHDHGSARRAALAGTAEFDAAVGPDRYGILGYVVVVAMLIVVALMYPIHRAVLSGLARLPAVPAAGAPG